MASRYPPFSHAQLKTRQRAERHTYPESLGLRVHRALSWLKRSEHEEDDEDARFIFLWIAFNAAYASEIPEAERLLERNKLEVFFDRIVEIDHDRVIYDLLWQQFPGAVRLLIENKYVFQPFWNSQGGNAAYGDWERRFEGASRKAKAALASGETAKLLAVVFDRLYTLRNQLVHGGATWSSSVNRDQVRDGANLLASLVPTIIALMMDNPKQLWGDPQYPVVE